MDANYVKEQICDVCHKMWQLGWVAANDGNVSVKMEDGTWWITPSGISKSFITPDKLIRVDKDMNVVEGPKGYKPSSEMKMHMRCYEERDDEIITSKTKSTKSEDALTNLKDSLGGGASLCADDFSSLTVEEVDGVSVITCTDIKDSALSDIIDALQYNS